MRTITRNILAFSELSQEQKAKALERHRDWNVDYQWWEFTYDDAKEIGKMLGFDVGNIQFRGFWSQGDGACFTGRFSYPGKNIRKSIREHVPNDGWLHSIADEAQRLYRRSFYTACGSVSHRGHYCHERSMSVDLSDYEEFKGRVEDSDWTELCADFALWIYGRLQAEYEHLTSDESVSESLELNDVEFEIDEAGALLP